jgi:predicted small lipoprotein YifL
MSRTFSSIMVFATAFTLAGCNSGPSPADTERARAEAEAQQAVEDRAAEERRRSEEVAELERRATNLGSRLTEMQTTAPARGRTATAALRQEVEEDVKNAQSAVADLKTTTPENWWERHERAIQQSVDDVQADVQRLTRQKPTAQPAATAEPAATATGYEGRRDAFVTRLRARLDAMEEQLDKMTARGAVETEREDTKARIDKLQDDLDGLRGVSADDWWDVSAKRVDQYIDRVEDSIKRLDDNAARTNTPRR